LIEQVGWPLSAPGCNAGETFPWGSPVPSRLGNCSAHSFQFRLLLIRWLLKKEESWPRKFFCVVCSRGATITVSSQCCRQPCLGRLECWLPPLPKEKGALGTIWVSPAFRPLYWKVNRLSLPLSGMVFASFQQVFPASISVFHDIQILPTLPDWKRSIQGPGVCAPKNPGQGRCRRSG
jgi:hypothetical protein